METTGWSRNDELSRFELHYSGSLVYWVGFDEAHRVKNERQMSDDIEAAAWIFRNAQNRTQKNA